MSLDGRIHGRGFRFLEIETGFPVTAFSGTRFKQSRYHSADNALSTNLIPLRGLQLHLNRRKSESI